MIYKIDIDKKAQKFIVSQPKDRQKLIYKAIYDLPNGSNIRKLSGYRDLYRLRVGDYRIIYRMDNAQFTICVIDVGNRGQIYNKY